ncbi:hypothetical protein [Micromonospora chokoriensis]|uniref:hypothetical protein n=1 Tax=Micromonospora chokoriensis TaxID=356851 RepID=UPI0004C310F8|nr:hypothetical protein [Micromonospora chokoriensis]
MATSDPNKAGAAAASKAEAAGSSSARAAKTQNPGAGAAQSGGDQRIAGDASVIAAPVRGDITVTEGQSAPFSTKPGDVPVDPRSGRPFEDNPSDGLKGVHGEDTVGATGLVVPGVDPDRIPAEVTPGVTPDAGGDKLFAAALAKAPSLTREFVDKMGITDEMLGQIARGEVPPPPAIGPIYTADLYLTPGGWQQTPPGVKPEDVGKNATAR